jgi:gluconolactonase
MKTILVLATAFLATLSLGCAEDSKPKESTKSLIIAKGAKLTLVSDGYKFTEGPAADAAGDVYFTDQPNDRIVKWSPGKNPEVFMKTCGRANGLFFDNDGHLLACADENNELWRINIATKEKNILLGKYDNKRFNGPNDVWVTPEGGLYFTDPFYKRPYWKHEEREQDGQHVYYLAPNTKKPVRVANDLTQPNGIVGHPKTKDLYIADIGAKKTYRYQRQDDGRLTNKTLLMDQGSDGMTLDQRGNIYITGKGVTVFNTIGEQIEQIPVPEGWTANVCFGGKERKTLFVTAMDSVYTLDMTVAGW